MGIFSVSDILISVTLILNAMALVSSRFKIQADEFSEAEDYISQTILRMQKVFMKLRRYHVKCLIILCSYNHQIKLLSTCVEYSNIILNDICISFITSIFEYRFSCW